MAKQRMIKSDREEQLLEQLRRHPELFERFQAILDLSDPAKGLLATADEIEERLVDEVRRLGKSTLESWADQREEEAAQEFKAEHPDARYGKKND